MPATHPMRLPTKLVCLLFAASSASAQAGADSAAIASLEQRVEDAVVTRHVAVLDSICAADFRFKHSTGQLDMRSEWLTRLSSAHFVSRRVDSLDVEVHGDVALTTGRVHVRRAADDPLVSTDPKWREYTIRYARVYVRRDGRWLLLTHHSTGESFGPLAPHQ